jgi:murein L,D-transpeptidase YcbB/YkuD
MQSQSALACCGRLAALAWYLALGLGCGAAAAADALPWFDGGRPGRDAQQAVEQLAGAAGHGLEPQDYGAAALQQDIERAARGAPADPATVERLAQMLTAAMQRYLTDLHRGRVDPRQIHHGFKPLRRDDFDAASALRDALAAHRVPDAVRAVAPQLPQYERLRQALARYRALADHPAWLQPLPPLPLVRAGPRGAGGKVEPGQAYAGLELLAQRLAALGDLAAAAPVTPRYEGALVDAVTAFQQRHGLAADGVVGKATLAQLQVSPAARVRQIELMLERLRWTPLMQGPRMVVINIPEFVLRAYEVQGSRIVVREQMKVIVGKAMDTHTPLFDEDMRYIEFRPYWNVPPSIARGELVPRLRRDPGYFEREGFEFVAAGGQVNGTLSAAQLDAVLAGQLRIRQQPGPKNALGDIKFVFPNRGNIYLHHTPSVRLFERERRDFSHGCIRVEHPVALARFVLQGMPEWTEERIRQAIEKGTSATLRLAEPVPVLIAYGTALVIDGRIHFFEDLYGLDRLLDAALRQRTRERQALH